MKLTAVQWQLLMQTTDAAKLAQTVQDSSNEWLQAYAQAGAEAVPMIAEAINIPTLRPDTIAAMADSLATQAQGIVDAIEKGAEMRAEMEHAMMEAKKVLDGTATSVSEAIINNVIKSATKPLELEVSTSVSS
jgi:uncharacterized protein YaaN involved in tellurite resistance